MAIHHPRRLLALAAAALACAGCSDRAPTDSPSPPQKTSATTTAPAGPPAAAAPAAPRVVKWIDLQAGDCLAGQPPTDPAEVTVTVVDCATPHLAEAYLRADIPVDTALTEPASGRCEAGFVAYTGRSAAAGGFTITYLIDSEQDRTSNNPYPSTIICLVQNSSGQPLTGSARTRP